MDEDLKFTIAAARRMLYREGCDSFIAGHVSARASDGTGFWTTPFGYFDETKPSEVMKFNFDLQVQEGSGSASPAVDFQSAIYQGRPDVNSVIHTHSHWVTVLTTTDRQIEMFNTLSALFYEDQCCYEDDGSTPPVDGDSVLRLMGQTRNTVLLRNHGAIIAGDTLENATAKTIALELCARVQVEASMIGGTPIPYEPELIRGRADYIRYFLPNMWESNFRRLRQSDPEIFLDSVKEMLSA
jgi:L-fuculose-phosphate aldolase